MTSLNAALSFLSHIGFSKCQSSDLMKKFDNNMSCLMICSNGELIQDGLSLDYRLRLLRAIRCFHFEKWSKYFMNNFHYDDNHDSFEKFVYHLIKFHIWIIYCSWTLIYIEKYVVFTTDINEETLRIFYENIQRLKVTIIRLKQMIVEIKKFI